MPERAPRRRDLRCPYCGAAVEVSRDERSASYGDIECTGCAASWSGQDGAAQTLPVGQG